MSLGGNLPRRSVNTGQRPETQASSHARQSSSQTLTAPTPTSTIPEALKELRSLAEFTKTRVSNLEALLEPPALAQVTETKKIMQDAHRNLKRLQSQVTESESVALLGDATVETWLVYQRLVNIEEKLRRAVPEAPRREALQSATSAPQNPTTARRSRHQSSSGRVSFALTTKPTVEEKENTSEEREQASQRPFRLWTWPDPQEWEEDRRQLTSSLERSSTVPASSVSPTVVENELQVPGLYQPSFVERAVEQTDTVSTAANASRKASSEDPAALLTTTLHGKRTETEAATSLLAAMVEEQDNQTEAVESPDSIDGLRTLYLRYGLEALPSKLARTPEEVERSCAGEETFTTIALHDPHRKRDGSIPGSFATYVILAGIDDPSHCLPRLRFIKIHELKRLKEWLTQKLHLGRSGEISRIEKVLHLIFVLQEGWRMETIAVLFSRTPQQVYDSCRDVFSQLLEMHSETFLEYHQPICHHLWKIAPKFMSSSETDRWEQYYHWKKQEVFNVLVTLNMYIGRYRQQGKIALDGPYQHWWRHFTPPEPTAWLHS